MSRNVIKISRCRYDAHLWDRNWMFFSFYWSSFCIVFIWDKYRNLSHSQHLWFMCNVNCFCLRFNFFSFWLFIALNKCINECKINIQKQKIKKLSKLDVNCLKLIELDNSTISTFRSSSDYTKDTSQSIIKCEIFYSASNNTVKLKNRTKKQPNKNEIMMNGDFPEITECVWLKTIRKWNYLLTFFTTE